MNKYGTLIVDEVVDVWDGDSFRCNILSLPRIIGDNIGIRVLGVDTPEIRGKSDYEKKLARDARDFTEMLLDNAFEIMLTSVQRDKYFRLLANVLMDGCDLADALINANLGRKYDGGTRLPWNEVNS